MKKSIPKALKTKDLEPKVSFSNQKEKKSGEDLTPDMTDISTSPTVDKKINISAAARELGLDRKTIYEYIQTHGLHTIEEMRIHRDSNASVPITSEEALELKMQSLKAKTSWEQSRADLALLELAEARGSLISIDEVCEVQTAIATKVKAQLKTLCLTLPPQIEGLPAREMSKKIEAATDAILGYLFDEMNME